jgi:hypothetical protein
MKGQAISQIFVYFLTLVIVSFILFYGYRSILTFKEKSDQVSFLQFKKSLQNTVEVLSVDFGSVSVKEFIVSDNIKEVCFVRNYPNTPIVSGTNYPLLEDSVNSGVDKNIFLVDDGVAESFFIGGISTEEDLLCTRVIGGAIKLRMEGRGDHTFISLP